MNEVSDLLIHGGRIVTANGTIDGSILVDKGKIVSISEKNIVAHADVETDTSGLYVLPGLIDTHVHFRDPGMIQKEDFLTGQGLPPKEA